MSKTTQFFKSKRLIIVLMLLLTALIAVWMLRPQATDDHDHAADNVASTVSQEGHEDSSEAGKTVPEHTEEGVIHLSAQQFETAQLDIATVERQAMGQMTQLTGTLQLDTDQQAHVATLFAGQVEQVNVSTGQAVQRGQVLATVLIPELVDYRASLTTAQADVRLAQENYQREKSLWQQGISAKQDYLQADNDLKRAQIAVRAAEQRLKAYGVSSTDAQAGRMALRAPISGTILNKDILAGEYIQPNKQLFQIARLDALWVEFAVPEQDLNVLGTGTRVWVQTDPQSAPVAATILTFTPSADPQSRQRLARARLGRVPADWRPDLFVTVQVEQPATAAVLAVAREALQTLDGQTVVFVLQQDGDDYELKVQPIQIADRQAGSAWVEVLQGLDEGAKYVREGSAALKSELEKGEATHAH
ncbi:MAG: efflux RND transporter periplasmic adaptor subunit [Pseudomonadota bacterium]|nr:efflux RND transporter periplasmic adaptor subunit [Pseudomonadota bacterium]